MPKEKGKSWSASEICSLLDIMIEEKVMELFDDKKTRSKEVFKLLKSRMCELGFERDEDQIKYKFQKLKSEYMTQILNNSRSGRKRMDSLFTSKLDILIKKRPAHAFRFNGCESMNDMTSSEHTPTDSPTLSVDAPTPPPATSGSSEVNTEVNTQNDSTTPEPTVENTPELLSRRSSVRVRQNFRAIVQDFTQQLTESMVEDRNAVIASLEKLEKENQKFQLELQKKDQEFLQNLFNQNRREDEQQIIYCVNQD